MLVPAVTATETERRPPETGRALLSVEHLVQEFVSSVGLGAKRRVQAVSDVSFDIFPGETLTLVGESGCGKSSLARSVMQFPRPVSGKVEFRGSDLTKLRGDDLRKGLLGLQVIFQDPYSSLDPRYRVENIVAEPLVVNGIGTAEERRARVTELLEAVGLDISVHGRRRPRELSGGQCQRVAVARALALHPQLLICDEPVSSLDVSVQAQILNLFEELRREFSLSYLFITHDLSVAKHVSDRVAVMYLGKLVETAPAEQLFERPLHPYASALLSAIPGAAPETGRTRLTGDLPSAADPPSGCRFRTRCPYAAEICALEEPPLVELRPSHFVACHFPLVAPVTSTVGNGAAAGGFDQPGAPGLITGSSQGGETT
jgi:peptide/nickel transport system ATP-binding protein